MEPVVTGTLVARLRGVTHRYGKTLALDRVDLNIPAGCLAGVIGPDGVGKSTLFGVVAGARKIQTGSVEVLGGDIGLRRFRAQVAPRAAASHRLSHGDTKRRKRRQLRGTASGRVERERHGQPAAQSAEEVAAPGVLG